MIRAVARTYRNAFEGLPRPLWLLAGGALINRSGSMVLTFLALYLTQYHEMSPEESGRILVVYGVGAIVGSYLGGWSSDRIGAMRTQRLSLIAGGAAFFVFPLFSGFVAIAIGAALVSVLSEAFRPAVMGTMAAYAPPQVEARAFALLRLAVNLGMAIGPAIGGLLAGFDYRLIFLVDAVTCWAAAVFLYRRFPSTDPPTPHKEAVDTGRSPWQDPPFLLLILIVLAMAVGLFQLVSTVPIYLRTVYLFREGGIGLLFAYNALMIVLFEMVLVRWAERYARIPLIAAGCFLLCAGIGVLPFGRGALYAVFAFTIWSVGEMVAFPLINALVADRAGARHRGRYLGLYSTAFSVAFAVGPWLGTLIYERAGPDTLFTGVLIFGAVLGLAIVGLGRWLDAPQSQAG